MPHAYVCKCLNQTSSSDLKIKEWALLNPVHIYQPLTKSCCCGFGTGLVVWALSISLYFLIHKHVIRIRELTPDAIPCFLNTLSAVFCTVVCLFLYLKKKKVLHSNLPIAMFFSWTQQSEIRALSPRPQTHCITIYFFSVFYKWFYYRKLKVLTAAFSYS